jgi:predicted DNA-binding transcriptional regulator AlpA
MAKKQRPINDRPLNPDWFYRLSDGYRYFGYRPTTLDEKIQKGEIPAPIALSDTGRARGWFGRTILKWQAEREAKAKATGKGEKESSRARA